MTTSPLPQFALPCEAGDDCTHASMQGTLTLCGLEPISIDPATAYYLEHYQGGPSCGIGIDPVLLTP